MPKRAAVRGAASVSSFASRTCGSSSPAARSKCGAIIRHGPHQAAQKSTTTGTSFYLDAAIMLAFISFISSLVAARYWGERKVF